MNLNVWGDFSNLHQFTFNKKADIILLQETHSTIQVSSKWKKEHTRFKLSNTNKTKNIIDTWWKENSNKRLFTFHNYNHLIHSRIDKFYTNKIQKIEDISIFTNNISDRDGLKLMLKIKKKKMGKGYWKLNNSILKQDFQEMFCKFWKDLQNQKPKYNFIN